jgi:hypothetical protein
MPSLDAAPDPDLAAWLDRLDTELSSPGSASLDTDERELILDLARIAAHRGVRVGAPITTYLAGMAVAGLPAAERRERLTALVEALDTD